MPSTSSSGSGVLILVTWKCRVTIDDPKTYTKPWTVTIPWVFMADTELLDWVCENEKDFEHLVGK